MTGFKDLEQTTLPRILVHLSKKGEATRTDLKRSIDASQQAIYNALPLLKENNLIKETTDERFPFAVKISLTEKGKKVAEYLIKIEEMLKN